MRRANNNPNQEGNNNPNANNNQQGNNNPNDNQEQGNNNGQANNQQAQDNQPNPEANIRNVRPRLAARDGAAANLLRNLNVPVQPGNNRNAGANPQNPAFVNVQDPNLLLPNAPLLPNLPDVPPAQNNNQPINAQLPQQRRRVIAPAIIMPEPRPIAGQWRERNRLPNEAANSRRNVRNIPQDGSLQLPHLPNRPPNPNPNRILSASLQPRQAPRENEALSLQDFSIPAQNRAAQNPSVNNAAAANQQPQEITSQGNNVVAAAAQPNVAAQNNANVARAGGAVAQPGQPQDAATFRPIRSPRTPASREEAKESPRSSQRNRSSNRKRKGPGR